MTSVSNLFNYVVQLYKCIDKTYTGEELRGCLDTRNPAEISFYGCGAHDVFREGGRYVGTVVYSACDPPFEPCDHDHYFYAPGFFFFPHGMIDIIDRDGKLYRADLDYT